MKTLKKILAEVLKGKNIPTYLSILFVIVLFTLKFFKIQNEVDIQVVILAILTIILINKIQKKWILNEQTDILNEIDAYINKPHFEIIDSWSSSKVYEGIANTTMDIVLVQSWFPDIPNISEGLVKASTKCKINVDFYLIEPSSPFGVQRWKEVNKKLDMNYEDAVEKYIAQFNTTIENIKNRLDNLKNITYQIRTYSTLPALKFYIIDNSEFYFGWLGLEGNSTQNVCFHISKSNGSEVTQKACDKIIDHLRILKKESSPLM